MRGVTSQRQACSLLLGGAGGRRKGTHGLSCSPEYDAAPASVHAHVHPPAAASLADVNAAPAHSAITLTLSIAARFGAVLARGLSAGLALPAAAPFLRMK
jgi:hypothetical protein